MHPQNKTLSLAQMVWRITLALLVLNLSACSAVSGWMADQNFKKAQELESAGKTDEAIAAYTQAIDANPQHALALFQRGKLYFGQQKFEPALSDLQVAARLDAQNAEAAWLCAQIYLKQSQPDQALPYLDSALSLDASNVDGFYQRALVYVNRQQPQKALPDLDKAIELGLKDADAYYQRGLILASNNQPEKALADFDQTIRMNDSHAAAHLQRGLIYETQGQADKAFADFDKAIQSGLGQASAFYHRGLYEVQHGQIEEALIDFDRAIELDPAYAAAYFQRGQIWHTKANDLKSLSDFNQVAELQSNYPGLYAQRAATLLKLAKYQEALADLEQAVSAAPQDARLLFQRGYAHFQLGQVADAIPDLEKAIELADQDTSAAQNAAAHLDLGLAYARQGNIARTLAEFEASLRAAKTAEGYRARGDMHFSTGDLVVALDDYQKAIQLDKAKVYPELHMQAAMITFLLGDIPGAIREIDKYLAAPGENIDQTNEAERWRSMLSDSLSGKGQNSLKIDQMLDLEGNLPKGLTHTTNPVPVIFVNLNGTTAIYTNPPKGDQVIVLVAYILKTEAEQRSFDQSSRESSQCKIEKGKNMCTILFRNGPIGIDIFYAYPAKAAPLIDPNDLAVLVYQAIDDKLVALLPAFPIGKPDLQTIPPLDLQQ